MTTKEEIIHHTKKKISVEEIMAMNPCFTYSRRRVRSLFKKRERLSVENILDLPIRNLDKAWLPLHYFDTPTLKKIGYAALRAEGEKKPKDEWERFYSAQRTLSDRRKEMNSDLERRIHFWCVHEIIAHSWDRMKVMQRYLKKSGLLKVSHADIKGL